MATYSINKTATYLQVIADGREYVTDNDTTFAIEGGDTTNKIEFSYQNAGRGNVIQPVDLAVDTFTFNGTGYGSGQRDALLAAYRNSIVSGSPSTVVTQAFNQAGDLGVGVTDMVISRNFIAGITKQHWATLTAGLGTVEHDNTGNTAGLAVAQNLDRAVLQSKAHTGILYGAQWVGKMTINTGSSTSNVQMRIGWFDDAGDKSVGGDQLKGDGIYLEFANVPEVLATTTMNTVGSGGSQPAGTYQITYLDAGLNTVVVSEFLVPGGPGLNDAGMAAAIQDGLTAGFTWAYISDTQFTVTARPGSGSIMNTYVLSDGGSNVNVGSWTGGVDAIGNSLNIRSSTSGVTKSNVIASSQWDDPLDGTGASGITLAVNTYYTWIVKIPADGTGMLVLSIIAQDGNTYEVHRTPLQIVFVPDPVSPVFRSNSLPFRAEVEGLGSNTGSLTVKSFSVQSQGLGDTDFPSFPVGRDTTTIEPDSTNYMPVLLVRRSATFGERLNMLLDEIAATLQSTADRVHLIYYRVDPTDYAAWAGTAPTWNPAGNPNSGLEFAIDTGGLTLPVQLTNSDKLPPEHYVTPESDAFAGATWQENIIGQDIAGNSDIIAVFAKRVVGTGAAPDLLVSAEIKSW